MPFHCCMDIVDLEDHFEHCYASVLVTHSTRRLKPKLKQLENEGVIPFLTGWCAKHQRFSLIYHDPERVFRKPSAYYAHMLAVKNRTPKNYEESV